MPLEIERKYLVDPALLPGNTRAVAVEQAYLETEPYVSVRVRIMGEEAFITLKGPDKAGARPEFEYQIPMADAREIMQLFCLKPHLRKLRRELDWKGKRWYIDEFLDDNRGLWLAEIELSSRGETFEIPPWAVKEVTGDHRYYNTYLAANPWSQWGP